MKREHEIVKCVDCGKEILKNYDLYNDMYAASLLWRTRNHRAIPRAPTLGINNGTTGDGSRKRAGRLAWLGPLLDMQKVAGSSPAHLLRVNFPKVPFMLMPM